MRSSDRGRLGYSPRSIITCTWASWTVPRTGGRRPAPDGRWRRRAATWRSAVVSQPFAVWISARVPWTCEPRERQGIAVAHGLAERSERTERLARAAEIPERPGPHDHRDRARIRGREEPADRIHIGTDIAVDQIERGVGRLECLAGGRCPMPQTVRIVATATRVPRAASRCRRSSPNVASAPSVSPCSVSTAAPGELHGADLRRSSSAVLRRAGPRRCQRGPAVQQAQEAFGVAAHRVPLLGPNEILAGVLDVGDATLFGVPLRRDLEHTDRCRRRGLAARHGACLAASGGNADTPAKPGRRRRARSARAVRGPLRRPPDP